jgi:hypothetical protein
MDLKPLIDEAAILVSNKLKSLVIADLHLGIEAELKLRGVNIGSQTGKLLERAIKCVTIAKPDVIILLGDVKHNVPQISFRDRKEIPVFLSTLAEYAPLYIVKGNHDSHLNKLLPEEAKNEIYIKGAPGFLLDGVGYTHGHAWPLPDFFLPDSNCEYILIGHNHPRIRLVSSDHGHRNVKSVWIRAKCDYDAVKRHYPQIEEGCKSKYWNGPGVIIMPAFNEICGGVVFNFPLKKLLGPVAENLLRRKSDMEVYLLDGTYIGKIGTLDKL